MRLKHLNGNRISKGMEKYMRDYVEKSLNRYRPERKFNNLTQLFTYGGGQFFGRIVNTKYFGEKVRNEGII
jgi:hypothetical protein